MLYLKKIIFLEQPLVSTSSTLQIAFSCRFERIFVGFQSDEYIQNWTVGNDLISKMSYDMQYSNARHAAFSAIKWATYSSCHSLY